MSEVKIFWDPRGFELDSLGKKKYLRATDGDTPYISVPIRMLSIDTPEVHYPGTKKPSKSDDDLMQLAEWIDSGYAPVSDGLGAHLYPRLATGTAGTLHEVQGEAATTAFEELLTKPSGRKRSRLHQGCGSALRPVRQASCVHGTELQQKGARNPISGRVGVV